MIDQIAKKTIKASPALLKTLHRIVPKPIQASFVLYQLNDLAKDFIKNGELDFLLDKVAKFEIRDARIFWHFGFDGKKMVIKPESEAADVCFSANTQALVLMASKKVDPDTLFFNRDLMITGDTELGLEIKNLIDLFDIEQLPTPVSVILNKWSQLILSAAK